MRVWELAEELGVSSADVLALISPYDAYVTSHLANVPRQALDAIRVSPPRPARPRAAVAPDAHQLRSRPVRLDDSWSPEATTRPRPGTRPPSRRFRRRPGPKPVSFEPPYEEDHDGYGNDPTADLRFEPVWSTGDVARFFDVDPATVRQWVKRGHLQPTGAVGPSHVFDRDHVLSAGRAITARRKAPGQPDQNRPRGTPAASHTRPPEAGPLDSVHPNSSHRPLRASSDARHTLPGLEMRALHRLAAVTPNALVTTTEAATMLGLAPATIRAWVARGHLEAATADAPHDARRLHFRIADVYAAASRR